jgi:ubiquinone/menaquinone biosynthesis C-methylase UbiE
MLLNFVEKAMMNNPVRAAIQRHFEAQRLLTMGGRMTGGIALEIGCGRGVGIKLIFDIFGAERVDAFDLDPHMIELAKRRIKAFGEKVRLWTGDVTTIPTGDSYYDAVFDFGVIHHVPNWRDAIKEVYRVLKPRGRFYGEEVLKKFIVHPVWRRLLKHPQDDRFDHDRFVNVLKDYGFLVISTDQLWQKFGWFIVDKPT